MTNPDARTLADLLAETRVAGVPEPPARAVDAPSPVPSSMGGPKEHWLPIPETEGHYEASNLGRVRSLSRVVTSPRGTRSIKGRILHPSRTRQGYVSLPICGKRRFVHALVLAAFVGPRPPGMVTRHLNGNKVDNRPENLAYGTHSENQLDNVRLGTDAQARKTHCPQGHPYSGDNLLIHANGRWRLCRTCRREAQRRRYIERGHLTVAQAAELAQ